MSRARWCWLALLGGCAPSYTSSPFDPRVALSELRETQVAPAQDGLGSEEAVAIALVHNVELRALRRERAVAEGAVLSAGAWRNPELRPSLTRILSGDPVAVALGVRFFPPPPGEHDALVERAKARERRVLCEIEAVESRVSARVRLAHARLLLLAERRRLLEATAKLYDGVIRVQAERVAAEQATRLDLATAVLEREKVASDLAGVAQAEPEAKATLAGLLGVASFDAPLRGGARCTPLALPSDEALESTAIARRPDLRALAESYQESEQEVRLEEVALVPWLSFVEPGLSRIPDDMGADLRGAIELPFDRSRLVRAEDRRTALRDQYLVRLADVRLEIRVARARFEEMERRSRHVSEVVAPAVADAEQLLQQGLASGEVEPNKLATLGRRVLEVRLAASDAELDCVRAKIELMRALGTVLDGEGASDHGPAQATE